MWKLSSVRSVRNCALSGARLTTIPKNEPTMYAKQTAPMYRIAAHTRFSVALSFDAATSPYPVEVTVVTAK
eukprot:jgi/Chrpa1/16228/Chrysochromulina_OHIO_Genome00018573-RA